MTVKAATFTRSSVVLVGLACVLHPVQLHAQPTGTSQASSIRTASGSRAVSKPPRSTAPVPVRAPHQGSTPVPPTFYSISQFGDHLQSVRWELAVVGGAMVAVGLRDWDWGGSRFRFIEEGWFGKNTRHGGMDKIGHAFSTYVIADILTERIQANASNPAGAQITGALVAFSIMTLAETLDGFTGKHRFSREDVIANAAGAVFSIIRNSIPGLRNKLDWRIMYTSASDELPGISSWESEIIPPYERQRYIMAVKGSGFEALKNTPWRFAELHAGFDARGFEQRERQLGHPLRRNFYVGIGLNLDEVLFGAGPLPNFAPYRDTLPARAVRKTLEYVQVPYTSVYHRTRFSTPRR